MENNEHTAKTPICKSVHSDQDIQSSLHNDDVDGKKRPDHTVRRYALDTYDVGTELYDNSCSHILFIKHMFCSLIKTA